MKILIADENDDFLKWLSEIISGHNDECMSITDGTSLDSICKEYKPDILLLDLQIRNIDIFKTVKRIKKENPGVVTMLVSGFNDIKLREEAEKAGAVFILKENLFDFYSGLKEHTS